MHVLIIPSWYKNPKNKMVGSFFEEQARGLLAKEVKVGLFHIEFKPFSYSGELPQREFIDNGLTTYQYYYKGIFPRTTKINYLYFCQKAYEKFKQYVLQNGKPDVIHAHSVFYGGIVARYISKRTGIPYVITEHLTSFVSGGITNKTDLAYAKKVFTDSKRNIVVSSVFKEDLPGKLNLPQENFHVIHNMVGSLFFKNISKKNLSKNQHITFFTNSFITERKNHRMLLEAFKIFNKEYSNSELIIGGDSTNEIEYQIKLSLIAYCKELDISDKVTFLGSLTRQEVKTNLDACNVFLLTSKYETFGVVLIEALAAGRPIITTNSKGPVDIITKKNGILVNSWEVVDFVSAMKNLIENYSTYNQEEISKDCKNNFGEDKIVNQLIATYNEVLKNNNAH